MKKRPKIKRISRIRRELDSTIIERDSLRRDMAAAEEKIRREPIIAFVQAVRGSKLSDDALLVSAQIKEGGVAHTFLPMGLLRDLANELVRRGL